MNEKIPLKTLCEKIAYLQGCTIEDAETNVKCVFDIIGKHLVANNIAEFPNLGLFTVDKSKDIKIIFTPDAQWATAVNAPFSMFNSEEIPSDLNIELLNNADTKIEYNNNSDMSEESSDIFAQTSNPTIDIKNNPDITVVSDSNDNNISSVSYFDENSEQESYSETEKTFGKGFIFGLIIGLAIGALALCCYVLYYVGKSPLDSSINEKIIEIENPEMTF